MMDLNPNTSGDIYFRNRPTSLYGSVTPFALRDLGYIGGSLIEAAVALNGFI